jgi:hypothetical protein
MYGGNVRLLIHDTLITSPFTIPLTEGWATPTISAETRSTLTAGDLAPDDVALLPAGEIVTLHSTHLVVPDFAAVSFQRGAIAMRVPVRPDEIRMSPIRMWDASSTAEIVARATLHPFYGITPTIFTSSDSSEAQVVILEGSEALRQPEAGFAEDLVRAWYILTEQPIVSHLLVAPKSLERDALASALSTLADLRLVGHERRKDVRRSVTESADLDPNAVTEFFLAQRYVLEANDRRALLMLLQRGNKGSAMPYVWDVAYLD